MPSPALPKAARPACSVRATRPPGGSNGPAAWRARRAGLGRPAARLGPEGVVPPGSRTVRVGGRRSRRAPRGTRGRRSLTPGVGVGGVLRASGTVTGTRIAGCRIAGWSREFVPSGGRPLGLDGRVRLTRRSPGPLRIRPLMIRAPPHDRALMVLGRDRSTSPGIVPPRFVTVISLAVAPPVVAWCPVPVVAASRLGVVSSRPVGIVAPAVGVLVAGPGVLAPRSRLLPGLQPAPGLSRPRVRVTPQVAEVTGTAGRVPVRLVSLTGIGGFVARAPSVAAARPATARLVAVVAAAHVPPVSGRRPG